MYIVYNNQSIAFRFHQRYFCYEIYFIILKKNYEHSFGRYHYRCEKLVVFYYQRAVADFLTDFNLKASTRLNTPAAKKAIPDQVMMLTTPDAG